VVEPEIMQPQYLVELVQGFTVEDIGKNLMKIKNNFQGSDGILGSSVENVQ
jgi:hypothetical protein